MVIDINITVLTESGKMRHPQRIYPDPYRALCGVAQYLGFDTSIFNKTNKKTKGAKA